MNSLELKMYPDTCLRIKTRPVEVFTPEFKEILRLMTDVMYVNRGIGLAATQVGLGMSCFVVDVGDDLQKLANPVILERSDEMADCDEGCLSLPGITVKVKRPVFVKVRAQDENGEFFVRRYDGLLSVAVQHEMEHLAGRLIMDHLNPVRYFIATRRIARAKQRSHEKTCEVVCADGKKDYGRPKSSS